MSETYDPTTIEEKWQRVWDEARAWHVDNPVEPSTADRSKSYVLEMLPYPSGSLHLGHLLVYTIGDVVMRFRRRNGLHVLHPMGWDAFGLPAENNAIKEGVHPRESTERNIVNIRRTMRRMGWWFDWEREISTHDPRYYRWQQWQFLRFLEQGLAYRKGAPVKWCPNDQTVLANEQVLGDGTCERCGALVESRVMEQWFFRITDYADALLDDLDTVDWPESIKARQRNWIGRSEGAELDFLIEEWGEDITVFTTRPDTLFGATFFVLAPEHELIPRIESEEVQAYVRHASAKKTEERAAAVEKTGVFTGLHAVNPVNGERIPVYVADYVLTDYGTGAIMAVPAHDQRDYDFAQAFGLRVRQVIRPAEGEAELPYVSHAEDDVLVDSVPFDGLPAPAGGRRIVERLAQEGRGRFAVNFRLRDWGFSRQRYWGSPIPVVYCDTDGIVPVPDDELPVVLPEVEDYKPKGQPPLAQAEDWVRTTCPRCGGEAHRETETMDTFVDSSWYFLRYCDPDNATAPFDRAPVDYWNPVDLYIGGVDHATMHMIYARFWMKVLNDLGYIGFREPFESFFSNGWVTSGGRKISKRSGGAAAGPDAVIERYGADTGRLSILFLGPADQDMEWTEEAAEGIGRFVRRLWRVVNEVVERAPADDPEGGALARKAHETIVRVTDDVGRRFAFNTGISAVMELVNELSRDTGGRDARFAAETAVSLIQPYAPHVAEELWERLGRERLWEQPWPVADEAMLEREIVEIVLQVNGKLRDRLQVPVSTSEEELVALARASERVEAHLNGGEPRKTIVVPGKLVNFVVR
jgi:leucyl-tRNA synthetase